MISAAKSEEPVATQRTLAIIWEKGLHLAEV